MESRYPLFWIKKHLLLLKFLNFFNLELFWSQTRDVPIFLVSNSRQIFLFSNSRRWLFFFFFFFFRLELKTIFIGLELETFPFCFWSRTQDNFFVLELETLAILLFFLIFRLQLKTTFLVSNSRRCLLFFFLFLVSNSRRCLPSFFSLELKTIYFSFFKNN